MAETKKFLKLHNLKIPAGWRKMRLGENFYGKYGFLSLKSKSLQILTFPFNLRSIQAHFRYKDTEGIYLKKK